MASINRFALLVLSLVGMSIVSLAMAQDSAQSSITSSLCNIISTIQGVVGVIALALFILGGAMYAIAHMLPAAGNIKGNMQGWALGMIIGGIVGLIIVIIAPGLISMIITSAGGSAHVVAPDCPWVPG